MAFGAAPDVRVQPPTMQLKIFIRTSRILPVDRNRTIVKTQRVVFYFLLFQKYSYIIFVGALTL